jgi:hypothetical protein
MAGDIARTSGLGVGILYNPALPELLRSEIELIDYLSITPDMFWTDHGPGAAQRFTELDPWIDMLDWTAARRPIVAHSIGLSVGSAEFSDPGYVDHLAAWHRRYGFQWHSDHLSFAQVRSAFGHEQNAGMAVPLPYDFDVLEMVAARVRSLCAAFPSPFLVENNVSYLVFPDQEMTEPEFLNRLVEGTGCGLLLDLHNLYTNARNHGFDASGFLRQLNLDAVVEVHVAGGNEFAGMYTDSHAGPCPPPVWKLLEEVLPSAGHLKGITFEFHDSYFPRLGAAGVRAQLGQARKLWNRYHATP